MELEFGSSAFRGVNEAFPDAQISKTKGISMVCKPQYPTVALIGLKYAVIENERIIFGTRNGELVNLKLNCRENLQLSPSPVVLQIRRVEDEEDVADVAVVKFSTSECGLRNPSYWAVCDGLILSKFIILYYVELLSCNQLFKNYDAQRNFTFTLDFPEFMGAIENNFDNDYY